MGELYGVTVKYASINFLKTGGRNRERVGEKNEREKKVK